MANLLCASFLREKFSFPWSILSFFRSGLPKPHCVRFWQPSRSQKRKNWSRKRKSFSQKRNCACELCHFSATLFQLLRRFISGHVQKDVQCDKCDHVFKREMDYLQHHKSQHGGFPAHLEHKVKFLCDQCPAAYTTYVGLYLHRRKNHNISTINGKNSTR